MSKSKNKTVKKQKVLAKLKLKAKKMKKNTSKKMKAILGSIKAFYKKAVAFIFSLPVIVAILLSATLALAPAFLIPYAYKLGSLSSSHPSSFTVMLTDLKGTGGGSGSIISTSVSESVILTNEHVCSGALSEGGKVKTFSGEIFLVSSYEKSRVHDLCLVRVAADLKVKVSIAKSSAELYSKAIITGHPSLMPNIITEGHFGGREIISLIVGMKKCVEKDWEEQPMLCMFFGGIPVIKHFEAQVVSALVMPGSSGSAVLNSSNELAGVVFAGKGRGLSYAYIVPIEAVMNFLSKETQTSLSSISSSLLEGIIPMNKLEAQRLCSIPKELLDASVVQICEKVIKEEML